MKKNAILQVITLIFLFSIISIGIIPVQGDFTIEIYWKEGGTITFEEYTRFDFAEDIFDYDSTYEGTYYYNGTLSTGDLGFYIQIISPGQEYVLVDTYGVIHPYFYIPVNVYLEEGDIVEYVFTVNDSINFMIFNTSQYSAWLDRNEFQSINSSDFIHTSIGADYFFEASSPDNYIFVWSNPESGPVFIEIYLFVRKAEKVSSEFFEINPITLETEGEEFTVLGMDTSGWEIEDEISFVIDEKDVDLTIDREDNYRISYNGKSTEIPCWILEVEDHETKIVTEDTFTVRSDYKIWKSKYSGVTLKSISDIEYYNSDLFLISTLYSKYTVESIENVLLKKKSSGIYFPLIPIFIGILILVKFKKSRFREGI